MGPGITQEVGLRSLKPLNEPMWSLSAHTVAFLPPKCCFNQQISEKQEFQHGICHKNLMIFFASLIYNIDFGMKQIFLII